jgi:UDP:flavonoid glycosyltransferase YjiC (YdhE family)
VVAAVRKLPWLSVALQPAIFFSKYDPAVVASIPAARHLYPLGHWVFGCMLSLARIETRRWAKPVFDLRKKLGIANTSNPVMEGAFSPFGTLTLFSEHFAQAQRDWPPDSMPTGFVFYDKRGEGFGLPAEHAGGMSDALRRFLASGPAPALFTLGSSAVTHPGTFYEESAAAAKKLGIRAVMLVGKQQIPSGESIHVEEYASYSAVMRLVSAVVHQGGIGTVAQTLRAGKPMLIVPWAHDQPDNGYRLQRMGVGRVLPRDKYTAANAARELGYLLKGSFASKAEKLAASIRREDGLNAACDRIERMVN